MRIFGYTVAFVVALAPLATAQIGQPALPEGVPPNYRQLIVQDMKSALTANSHIHHAQISNPEVTTGFLALPLGRVTTYCVKFIATGILGRETSDARVYNFSDGKFVNSGPIWSRLSYDRFCASRAFGRFPEFDGVR
jgi:hypothetical protein